jgi:hypothetical protein
MKKPHKERRSLSLIMAALAMVLLVYVAAFSVVIEFVYRHLIAVPISWLLGRLMRAARPSQT